MEMNEIPSHSLANMRPIDRSHLTHEYRVESPPHNLFSKKH